MIGDFRISRQRVRGVLRTSTGLAHDVDSAARCRIYTPSCRKNTLPVPTLTAHFFEVGCM
jgi:hypothetical protein